MAAETKTLPQIKGFNPTTFIDWEGRVAAIIFLAGCNFRCPYCHSSDLVLAPEKIPDISLDEVKTYLIDKKNWIEGLVVTGGEPTVYHRLPEFISEFKKIGMPIKLDTNGSNPERLKELLDKKLLDYVAMDIKASLEQTDNKNAAYQTIAGVNIDIDKITESIELIKSSNVDYEFRTTVAPGQLQTEDIASIACFISGARRYILQQFVPRDTLSPEMMKQNSLPIDELEKMAESARKYVPKTCVRAR